MSFSSRWRPESSWLELGEGFADVVQPQQFPQHVLRYRNHRWAQRVGLHELTASEWESHFAALQPLPGSLPERLALRYHGHQFRHFNPQLGDGRGFLLAQMRDDVGRLLDFGTKGSGRTPWSRGGDGRLTLKGGVREILATEMLEAQGVYTSKSFSLFETGESLYRGDEPSPTRSSILVRLGHSHVRFGTFQFHAWRKDTERLTKLVEYCQRNFYPEISGNIAEMSVQLLRRVSERMAALVASWTVAGFVHGVLNTDNMCITGESFDYGPWRWTPTMDPDFTAAYFDQTGLYSFGRQPQAVLWNLHRLADTLTFLVDEKELRAALEDFPELYSVRLAEQTLKGLGLRYQSADSASELADAAFMFLHRSAISFPKFWFDWHGGNASADRPGALSAEYSGNDFQKFRDILATFEPERPDALQHPYFQHGNPCSMLIDEVEAIWEPIAAEDDWSLLESKLDRIREMGDALQMQPAVP